MAAYQGEPLALCDMATRFAAGFGVECDMDMAMRLYRRAAKAGLARAQYRLAECCLLGNGTEYNTAEAVQWLRAARDGGLPEAGTLLVQCCIAEGPEILPGKEGVDLLRKTAEDGNAKAAQRLAQWYAHSEGVVRNRSDALKWYRKAIEWYSDRPDTQHDRFQCHMAMAHLGDAESQFFLAECHAKGDGVPQNQAETVRWYEQAVENGLDKARAPLAEAYVNLADLLVKSDDRDGFSEAFALLRKAAAMGNGKACLRIAEIHLSGNHASRDRAEAVKWLRQGADFGDPLAQFRLGLLYAAGDGVAKDSTEALGWFHRAADAGFAPAQFKLGQYYAKADETAKDPVRAAQYLAKATEQGYVRAQRQLGICYFYGNGVAKDVDAAIEWFYKAAKAGDADARDWLEKHAFLARR